MVTAILDLSISHLAQHFHCCMCASCQHLTKTLMSETAPWCGDISSFIKNEASCAVYRCIRFLIFFHEVLCDRWENVVFYKMDISESYHCQGLKSKGFAVCRAFFFKLQILPLCCFILLGRTKKILPPLENWKRQRRNLKSSGKTKLNPKILSGIKIPCKQGHCY